MLPEGYKPSKKVTIASALLMISVFIYGIYINVRTYKAFSGEVRYTIGIITDRYIQASGREIDYIYRVNDSTYRDHAGYAYNSNIDGGQYWVKYSVEYPDVSKIYQNRPVPACIDTLPPNGFRGRYDCKQFEKWREWAERQKNEVSK